MYFVDRELIEERLLFLEARICLFEETPEWKTGVEKAALERVLHLILDSFLDVGNSIIDGFIMRDPGSYEDIVDILEDEKVITKEMSDSFKRIIPFRKILLQSYLDVDHEQLRIAFHQELSFVKQFSKRVREYLINELGPVSAFKR
jgi:uncharacterized protein YutE (UPF0331/DUF86 family)